MKAIWKVALSFFLLTAMSCKNQETVTQTKTHSAPLDTVQVCGKPYVITDSVVAEYEVFLSGLEVGDPQSILDGIERYDSVFGSLASQQKDAGFWVYLGHFYPWVRGAEMEDLEEIRPEYDPETASWTDPAELTGLKAENAPFGITFIRNRRSYICIELPGFLQSQFQNKVSTSLKEYLTALSAWETCQIEMTCTEEPSTFYEALGKALSVVSKQRESVEEATAAAYLQDLYQVNLALFLQGNEAFPVSQINSASLPILLPEVKTVYKTLAGQESGSALGKWLKEYLKVLDQHQDCLNEEVNAFIEEQLADVTVY